ncbi:MAG: purine-binding chemotaxis protein CheW [Bdellovibrionales bacterium]|nr:purine-binding chemotaxis protein CheW [Bdellovibrionales bacterium]
MADKEQVTGMPGLAGKYLTFALGEEKYGLDILKVVEIFGIMKITRVPRCPSFVKGVINLRGRVIPVIDLRLKLSMEERAHDEKTCIIVTNVSLGGDSLVIGMIVDTVLEVRDFTDASLEPAPDYGAAFEGDLILAMGKEADGRVTILLDIDAVFGSADADVLRPMGGEGQAAPI